MVTMGRPPEGPSFVASLDITEHAKILVPNELTDIQNDLQELCALSPNW